MKHLILLPLLLIAFTNLSYSKKEPPKYAIVIHGGAGTITKANITAENELEIKKALTNAILLGKEKLLNGATAMDVVEAVIKFMENSPLFNAGRGAVYNHEGQQEMDACIMDGQDLSSGAVAGVTHLKNPIVGARLVRDSTRHVLLSGDKAEAFCLKHGAEYADSTYFFVQRRWDYLQKLLKKEKSNKGDNDGGAIYLDEESHKYGTVGCVVLDAYGNLAAGTSTGGLTNKKYGRIGDSPIVGAGTYADNNSCAVSCTGTGEFFIRGTIARDIAALMEFKKYSLQKAGVETLKKLGRMKGDGGFIGVDRNGNVLMLFNTEGMYRASITANSETPTVKIYKD